MKRLIIGLVGVALVAAAGIFGLAAPLADRLMNQVKPPSRPLVVSQQTQMLHQKLSIVDLHADPLLWRRDLVAGYQHGQIDLRRLEQGNVALQVFSSVSKTPRGQNYERNKGDTDNITPLVIAEGEPIATWGNLEERNLYHATRLRRAEAASNGHLRIIRGKEDLQQLIAARGSGRQVMGGLLSIEGLNGLNGQMANLDRLYEAGFRLFGLAHFYDNEVAGSMHGWDKYGLTAFGRQVVTHMQAHHMLVDVAYASHQAVADVLAMAHKPVIYSHGGVKATCNTNRNLTDDEVRGIARTGGLIGIGYWETAVCGDGAPAVARALTHVRDIAGVDHVALGSDFDGAVTEPFDTAMLSQVTQALIDAGWSENQIRAAMGGNALRVFEENLP